jgi:hypothetical protein
MRKYILLLIVCVFSYAVNAATVPGCDPSPAINMENADPSKMKAKDIEQLLGRRLTLKERIGWMLVKRQFKKHGSAKPGFDTDKKARTAKTLGTLSLISLFIPFFGILALPLAITAIVIGSQVRRIDPDNLDARKAITRGIITLAIFVLVIVLVLALISAFTFT